MSILLPHFLNEGRGKLDTYFSRVYNPIWTNPDGFTWLEALKDPDKVNCHVALTPTWSETSWFADYVLPMGVGAERHDVSSYETHAGRWIGFRQSVFRRYAEIKSGEPVGPDARSHEYNPGEVWEENEFWIDLSWKIDPDGSLGIRQWFESDQRPGHPISVDEYYGHIFSEEVPGLAEAAAEAGQDPLEYMRDRGSFAVPTDPYTPYEKLVSADAVADCTKDEHGVFRKPGTIGTFDGSEEAFANTELAKLGDGSPAVEVDGEIKEGFPTPSKKLELFSTTLKEWGWPEYSTPKWIPSHVHWEDMDIAGNERILLPTFRIPTLIHTRSANSKWLNEISHRHPLWIHPEDAEKLDIEESGLVRITTRIGHFVIQAWRTEGIRPGVVAASHHMGRWRLDEEQGRSWASGKANIDQRRYDVDAQAGARQPAVRVVRPRHRPHLVARHRGPSERHVLRAARPDLGHAVLASAGPRDPGRSRRRVRRCRGRHRQVTRGLPRVDGQDPPGGHDQRQRPAPPALVRPPAQADARRLPSPRRLIDVHGFSTCFRSTMWRATGPRGK